MDRAVSDGRKVFLDFVGCRLNEAEIEHMARQFAARGDAITHDPAQADLVILNTCAVTNEAARKSRQMIRQAGRASPAARIVATGCYAELDGEGVAGLPGVARVIGNRDKDRLASLIAEDGGAEYEREPIAREALPPGTLGHTRAFLKAQDGCDNRCTFCITTLLRGPGRSRPLEEIVEEAGLLAAMGTLEIVLTGVHLGSYGRDGTPPSPRPFGSIPSPTKEGGEKEGLARLVRALLERTDVPRLRLSSLEPWDLTPGFFDLWQDGRLCPHLHLPLQSGCDAALRRMARRTTQVSFAALVEAARARIPDLALTTDIMVGFPGETDAEFAESLRFVEQIGFARLHVFPYSPRPGTAAAAMPGQVPDEVKKARRAEMQALSDRLERAFQQQQVGRTADVLWESARAATPQGFVWAGYTGNYVRVVTTSPRLLANTITPTRLTGVEAGKVVGIVS